MLIEARSVRRQGLLLLARLATVAIACARGEPAVAPAPAPTPAPVPSPPRPAAVVDVPGPVASPGESDMAARWLASWRAGKPDALIKLARTPFDFRDTRPKPPKGCKSRSASEQKGVKEVATCLAKDKLLHEDLLANPEPRIVAVSKGTLPGWAEPWAPQLGPAVRPMSVFIHANTSAFEIILLVTADGVRGVWQNVTIEPK